MTLDEVIANILLNGGITTKLHNDDCITEITEDAWYFPAQPDDTTVVKEDHITTCLREFIDNHHKQLIRPDRYLGVWRNPETGRYHIDVNRADPDKASAIKTAKEISRSSRQKILAIYNINRDRTIDIDDGQEETS